jgi:PAS domain S-box-containing protein
MPEPVRVGRSEPEDMRAELEKLRAQVADLGAVLDAIRSGGVDALVVGGPGQEKLYELVSADRPYRVIVEEMGAAAATISARGVLLYANPGLADLVGQDRSEVLGRNVRDLLIADPDLLNGLLNVGPGQTQSGQVFLVRGDGTRIPALASITGMDLDGTLVRCLAAVDLTDRLSAEASLAASERLYRMLAENTTDVIVQVGLDGMILWVSESARAVLGWDREAVVGTSAAVPRSRPCRTRTSSARFPTSCRSGSGSRFTRVGTARIRSWITRAGWSCTSTTCSSTWPDSSSSQILRIVSSAAVEFADAPLTYSVSIHRGWTSSSSAVVTVRSNYLGATAAPPGPGPCQTGPR